MAFTKRNKSPTPEMSIAGMLNPKVDAANSAVEFSFGSNVNLFQPTSGSALELTKALSGETITNGSFSGGYGRGYAFSTGTRYGSITSSNVDDIFSSNTGVWQLWEVYEQFVGASTKQMRLKFLRDSGSLDFQAYGLWTELVVNDTVFAKSDASFDSTNKYMYWSGSDSSYEFSSINGTKHVVHISTG